MTHHLLVKVDLDHRLDCVADVDKLEELEQGRDARRLLVLGRLVGPHLLGGDSKAGGNVPIAERLQKQDEDLFDRLLDATADSTRVKRKRLDALERLAIALNELEGDIERNEQL